MVAKPLLDVPDTGDAAATAKLKLASVTTSVRFSLAVKEDSHGIADKI